MLIVVLKNLRDIVKSLLECYMEKKSFELISPMNFSVWVSLADRGKLIYHSIFQKDFNEFFGLGILGE